MDLFLKGKVFAVSGGAMGIGRAISETLAAEGASVVIIGKDEADNISIVEKIRRKGGKADFFTAELTELSACERSISFIAEKYGEIHGLVNNAGLNDSVSLENGSYEEFIRSYQRNVVHYFLLAKAALPMLKKSKGSIVNISSKVAETGQGNTSGYAAANGARNALTREWAVELLPYSIRVNAVIVAESYTEMYQQWLAKAENPEITRQNILQRIPFENRMTKPEEIAAMVVFLLSAQSGHTTGQLIHVDGGYTHLDRAINTQLP